MPRDPPACGRPNADRSAARLRGAVIIGRVKNRRGAAHPALGDGVDARADVRTRRHQRPQIGSIEHQKLRADRCPDNKPTPTKTAPATPRTAGAKSGQSGKKVSFSKLQLNTAVQEAVKNTVHETMAAMAKNGWQKS